MTIGPRSGWLGPVESALDGAARPVIFFFRNDDVGSDSDALLPVIDAFSRHGTPLDLAVIPAAVDQPLADALLRRCIASAGLLRLHQHGWRHDNHERAGRKCEFGPSRSSAEQRSDLARGWERLSETLGTVVDPIFTPPWNRCDAGTVALLAELGFRALSRDNTARPVPMHGLSELPVSVDWSACERTGSLSERLAEVVAVNGKAELPVGVMLHHAVMGQTGRDRLVDLLTMLGRHPGARCVPMMDCIPASPAAV